MTKGAFLVSNKFLHVCILEVNHFVLRKTNKLIDIAAINFIIPCGDSNEHVKCGNKNQLTKTCMEGF